MFGVLADVMLLRELLVYILCVCVCVCVISLLFLENDDTVVYLKEVPLQSFTHFQSTKIPTRHNRISQVITPSPPYASPEMTGHDIGGGFIYWDFEYGKGYSGAE